MRKQIYQSLKKKFTERMSKDVPEFVPVKISSPYVGTKELVFQRVMNGVHHFVIVVPKTTEGESFTVELAWSRQARFPEISMRPSVTPTVTGDERKANEGSVRLRELVSGKDEWWDAVPLNALDPASVERYMAFQMKPLDEASAERLVEPLTINAVALLVERGIPYLAAIE